MRTYERAELLVVYFEADDILTESPGPLLGNLIEPGTETETQEGIQTF